MIIKPSELARAGSGFIFARSLFSRTAMVSHCSVASRQAGLRSRAMSRPCRAAWCRLAADCRLSTASRTSAGRDSLPGGKHSSTMLGRRRLRIS